MSISLRIATACLAGLSWCAVVFGVNEITLKVNGVTTLHNAGAAITVTLSGANDTVNVYSTSTTAARLTQRTWLFCSQSLDHRFPVARSAIWTAISP